MKSIRHLVIGLLIAFSVTLLSARAAIFAQSRSNVLDPTLDPRGPVEVTICSQNLNNYGQPHDAIARIPGMTPEGFEEKEAALVKRFMTAGCDIIAVQEVLSRDEEKGKIVLMKLAAKLKNASNRLWDAVTGPSNDPFLRNGFIFAKDRVEMVSRLSYNRVDLPKMIDGEKPKLFTRGPLEVQFIVRGQGESAPKTFVMIDFHFKSKRGGAADPAQLDWETYRMQMAEALRRIVLSRHSGAFDSGETILVLLGDRNSNFDAASAKILEGTLSLEMFKGDGVCRLSKRGVPLCQAGNVRPQRLFSVLTTDPQTKQLTGTHRYKKEYSWLDEILLTSPGLPAAWERFDSTGDFASGVIYEPREASDHGLVWTRLNW